MDFVSSIICIQCRHIRTLLQITELNFLYLLIIHGLVVFCIVGAAAHAAIFMVRDYDPANSYNNLLDRVIRHRDAIISHLNWVVYLFRIP